MGGIISQRGLEEMTDIIRFPNSTEAEIESAEALQRIAEPGGRAKIFAKRPTGYEAIFGPSFTTLMKILPGGQILFSLPIDHVSELWHLEIPFRLAIPRTGKIRPPYSYLALYQEDLPRAASVPR